MSALGGKKFVISSIHDFSVGDGCVHCVSLIVQKMNADRKRKAARWALLYVIHNHAMSDAMRGHLRMQVVFFDASYFGYTHVGQITAMLKDIRGWSVGFVEFMWYMMNMAYYKRIDHRECMNIIKICLELERKFGCDEFEYFVHGNVRYPVLNMMAVRHDVMCVIANFDMDAYNRLVEGIMDFDGKGRLLGRYEE